MASPVFTKPIISYSIQQMVNQTEHNQKFKKKLKQTLKQKKYKPPHWRTKNGLKGWNGWKVEDSDSTICQHVGLPAMYIQLYTRTCWNPTLVPKQLNQNNNFLYK